MSRVSFWAIKPKRKVVTIRFRRSDGSIARFRATKIIRRPIKVTFYSRKRKRYY